MWPKSPPSLQVVTHNARMDEERGPWGRPDSRVALLRPQTFGSLIQFMNSNVKVNPMFDFHPFKCCFETPGTVCCFETPGDVFSEFAKMQRWAGESFFTLDLGKIIIRSSLHKDQPNPWRDPIYVSSPTCSIIKMLYFLSKVKITIVNPPDSSRIILPHRGVSTNWSTLKSYVLPLNIANVVILKLPRILPWCFLPPLPVEAPRSRRKFLWSPPLCPVTCRSRQTGRRGWPSAAPKKRARPWPPWPRSGAFRRRSWFYPKKHSPIV